MVRRHFVQPRGEGARLVILHQLVLQFHEHIHGGIFGIFASRQRAAAKAENSRSVFAVKLAPGIGIPCPCPSNSLRRLYLTRRAHPLWSRRIHRLVRSQPRKNYTLQCPRTVTELATTAPRKVARVGRLARCQPRFAKLIGLGECRRLRRRADVYENKQVVSLSMEARRHIGIWEGPVPLRFFGSLVTSGYAMHLTCCRGLLCTPSRLSLQ